MRETAMKRISFFLECFMLYEVYSHGIGRKMTAQLK